MEIVERSEKHVVIPTENRVIAFRVEQRYLGSGYHDNVKIWPESGHIKSLTERGLFAVTFGQNYGEVAFRCAYYIDPYFHILEVDNRKIIKGNNNEIEFSEANILFCGYIEEFIIEIQKYATPEQYFDIYQTFFVKLMNVLDAKENPDHRQQYIINCFVDGPIVAGAIVAGKQLSLNNQSILENIRKELQASTFISKMWYRPEKPTATK